VVCTQSYVLVVRLRVIPILECLSRRRQYREKLSARSTAVAIIVALTASRGEAGYDGSHGGGGMV
jgi:hypothetical protein